MDSETLTSGELARAAGISPDTLRHYERVGVLARPKRGPNNYRLYPRSALERVRIVRHALAAGFTLSELAAAFRVREQGGAPCRQVKALLENKLAQLDQDIANLQHLRTQLRSLLERWHERLKQAEPGHPARLLESIPVLKKGNADDPSRHNRFRNRSRAVER